MIKQIEHIKRFALQDNSALTVRQLGEAIARMCDDAIHEAVEHTLTPDGFPPSHRDDPFCECSVCMGFVSRKHAAGKA